MGPQLNRLVTPARGPSLKDIDPSRLVASPSRILDVSASSSSSSSGVSSPASEPLELNFEDRSSSTIKLSHAASGRSFEVSLKDGLVLAQQLSVEQGSQEMEEKGEEDEEEDASEDAHLCEAVLRSIFAPSIPTRSIEDRIAEAEMVKGAFGIEDDSMARTVMSRAQKGAQYRLAELQLRYEELQRDELQSVHPAKFESPQHYEAWKEVELQELSTLISKLEALPSFCGSIRVTIVAIDVMQTHEVSCMSMKCSSHRPHQLQVYASVTVLPARTSSRKSSEEDDSDVKEPCPQFITRALPTTGPAKFNETSPWISVRSVQDKVLIEVWQRQEKPRKNSKWSKKFRSLSRRNTSLKVASWNGDAFLGQVILTFENIEHQTLQPGTMQAVAAPMSHVLTDQKGRQKGSVIHLRFQCSAERLYRDVPANKLLLRPPVSDLETAFDTLVAVGLRSQNAEVFGLEPQWRNVARTFQFHYRLREERCRLGLVNNFANLFQQDLRYLSVIVEEWLPVCKAARDGQLTKDEFQLHNAAVSLLIKPATDAIENFQAVFPMNQPPGAFSDLLRLLGLVLRWDPDPNEILIPLRSWIKNSFEKRFHDHLFGLRPSIEQPTKITAQTLTNVVRLVRRDLEELGTFADALPGGICLPEVAIPTYYKLVSAYVMNAIKAAKMKVFTKDYEDLVTEVLLLHENIGQMGQQCDLMDLHGIFSEHVTQLVDAARARMIDWVTSSVTSEKWEPLSPQSGALFSFSIVDLYFMIGEVMDEMMSTIAAVPFGKRHFSQVEEAICTAARTYVEVLGKLCLQEISGDNSTDLFISKAICVKLNNMNAVLEQHHDLERKLDETVQNGEHSKRRQDDGDGDESAAKLNLFTILERHSSFKGGLGSKFRELQHFTLQTIGNLVESAVYNMQGRIATELHQILQETEASDEVPLDQELQPLTSYLDSHLILMNDFLHPSLFKRMIKELCKAVIFCMEEYALNRDEDPNPMTRAQREKLEECLSFFYDYFYGEGLGLDSAEMEDIATRLRSILSCWDLDTRELCALYWREWDRFNDSEENGTVSTSRLHLLDYLSLLRQRTDDEAREIVDRQRFIATSRMMQFIFGLPKEEDLVASFPCKNSQNAQGTLYITQKHICFKDIKSALADSRMLYVVPIDRLLRVELVRRTSIVLVPFHQRQVEFSNFTDREAVCRTIFNQVVGSGSHLEKNMALVWSDKAIQSSLKPTTAMKVFKCWRRSTVHKYSGTLLVSAAYLLFTQDDKQKVIQIDHTSIARIHAGRRGLRPSGVVVQLKNGDEFEFCDFQAVDMSNKEIAKELNKLVFGVPRQ